MSSAGREELQEQFEALERLHEGYYVDAQQARDVIRRFLEWDALTALPDPLPAPFADLRYWLSEFRRTVATPERQPE